MTKIKYLPKSIALVLLGAALQPVSAQTFELSEKPLEISWPSDDWKGEHAFPPVYCLTFPAPRQASRMTTAMFNRNSISLTRLVYKNSVAIYIVTSTIPPGRTPEEDVVKMKENNLRSAEANPDYIKVQDLTSLFGVTGGLTIRNATEGGPKTPFPLARNIATVPDGMLRSLSVHRLFARGPDRFEVAALLYFRNPVPAADEQTHIAALSSGADATVQALYECTSKMPIRSRGPRLDR